MPSQGHKSGRFAAVSVRGPLHITPDALVHAVQRWLLTTLQPERYLVVAHTDGDVASCDACAMTGKPRRADNVRSSLRAALSGLAAVDVRSVRVCDGTDDLRRAATLLQAAPAAAVVRLAGWDESELRSPAAVAAIAPETKPRLRWVPRARGLEVLAAYVRPRDIFRRVDHTPPHGQVSDTDWALCPTSIACEACQAFSNAAYEAVQVDVPPLLRAALRDGWDVSALYDATVMEQLRHALADWVRVTHLRPPVFPAEVAEEDGEPRRKRRRPYTAEADM